jgi:hypothetical protein
MEGEKVFTTCENASIVEYKNVIIIILLVLFILALLGVNVCSMSSNAIDFVTNIFAPIFRNVLDMFGYSIGSAIQNTALDVKDGAIIGVDIAGDAVANAGGVIMQQTKKENFSVLDDFINKAPEGMTIMAPEPVISSNPIQKLSR